MPTSDNSYNASNIKVLKGLEAVRKRPGMYIGDTEKTGLHHLIWEVSDNSLDEAVAGYGDVIDITLFEDHSISVSDKGRGIPVDIHPTEHIPAATVILTVLHAGGKFDNDSYKTSGGLHGVGASVVNALSSYLYLTIQRNGTTYTQTFEKGIPVTELVDTGKKSKETGTTIHFFPDKTIFKHTEYDPELILEKLKTLSFLNKGIKFIFNNKIAGTTEILHSESGIVDFMYNELTDSEMLFSPIAFSGKEDNIAIDFGFVYETGFNSRTYSFANNVKTTDGGKHEIGSSSAFSRAIIDKIKQEKPSKDKKAKDNDKITSEDVKEGLFSVISVKLSEPDFGGQTKNKLNNEEARTATYKFIKTQADRWIEENPKIFKEIVKKIQLAKKAREAAKRSREMVRKDVLSTSSVLPGKLSDCQSNKPEECEIFFVEGDSAGGAAKAGRDSFFQAILPLKGKILNVVKNTFAKAMQNEEIQNIILTTGIPVNKAIDYSKLKYYKFIMMTDADVDGDHIGFLGLLFFYKYYPELIKNGHVYVVEPPLYRVKKNTGKESYYFETEKALKKKFPTDDSLKNWTLSRFKGLGEMNPEQLWDTTMNPKTRNLIQIKYNQKLALSIEHIMSLLGSEEPLAKKFRKEFLFEYNELTH